MWPGYKSLKQLLLVKKKCARLISSYIHGWVSGSWVVGWLAGKAENNAYFSLTWLELEFELHNNVSWAYGMYFLIPGIQISYK